MNAIRWWLIGMLLVSPFINVIYKLINQSNNMLRTFVNRLDEMTVLILFPIAAIKLYEYHINKNGQIQQYLVLLFSILSVVVASLISGMLNNNAFLATLLGTFAYLKFFFLLFIYAAFFRDFNECKKIFRIVIIIAVVIGIVAIIFECWALFYRYVLEQNVSSNGLSILHNTLKYITNDNLDDLNWRLGIYRTSSILSHYNLLGFYCVLMFTIYFHITKKINVIVFFSLLMGILTSVSRIAYICLTLLIGFHFLKGRRWLIIFLIPAVIVVLIMGNVIGEHNIGGPRVEGDKANHQEMISYREFARDKALEVWKDHPMWGVGPGMYGGAVAFKYRSPWYEEYNFTYILKWFHHLDQVWPQVLAEIGIVGTAAFAGLFFTLLITMINSINRATSDELKALSTGLVLLTIFIIINTLGSTMNYVAILFPFFAVAGMGLGSVEGHSYIFNGKE